jgi:hypothetical protein
MRGLLVALAAAVGAYAQTAIVSTAKAEPDRAFLDQYCVGCHNERAKIASLTLDRMDPSHVADNAETWEKVVRKLKAGMMPPSGARRPDRATVDAFTARLEAELDRAAAAHPNPGATALHRLNRSEYTNVIRDLLSLDVDAITLLTPDDSSEGFDNIADALKVSPALLERYVSAAAKVSRLAVGDPSVGGAALTYRAGSGSQREHTEGLPFGTHGGILINHDFPLDGEYTFKVKASTGLPYDHRIQDIEVTVDGAPVAAAKISYYDAGELRIKVNAGPRSVGIAFSERDYTGVNELFQTPPNNIGISSVTITGPFNPAGPGDTPSRRRIFVCRPAAGEDELPCAGKILSTLATRAWRRPLTDDDLEKLLGFYQRGRNDGGDFDYGVEMALARILVGVDFVFRFEKEPARLPPGVSYRISDLELASRLSFFLWSSIPDDELLDLAVRGKLHEPAALAQQTRRMLADPRSQALATNFAGQWLALREVKNAPAQVAGNIRQSFHQETELLFESILREDRSLLTLLNADYTFVDERLAKHYGIPNVYGSQFRRVAITDENRRGLLGQGSFLLVTSVADRTSPVARGKWILENLLGTPAPIPPPNVPPLDEEKAKSKAVTLRQMMEEHRSNAVCAGCHKIMDPIGFSLENFDLNGKWRTMEGKTPIDASSELVDGTRLTGPASLREAILNRSDIFVTTATEKLLTYALGRALRYYDMPTVRSIVRDAAPDDYRFSKFILGIVRSDSFQMRIKRSDAAAGTQTASLKEETKP